MNTNKSLLLLLGLTSLFSPILGHPKENDTFWQRHKQKQQRKKPAYAKPIYALAGGVGATMVTVYLMKNGSSYVATQKQKSENLAGREVVKAQKQVITNKYGEFTIHENGKMDYKDVFGNSIPITYKNPEGIRPKKHNLFVEMDKNGERFAVILSMKGGVQCDVCGQNNCDHGENCRAWATIRNNALDEAYSNMGFFATIGAGLCIGVGAIVGVVLGTVGTKKSRQRRKFNRGVNKAAKELNEK